MLLPLQYIKKPSSERAKIMQQIGEKLNLLDPITYPNLYNELQGDESKVAVITEIINEMYGSVSNADVEDAIENIENTLAD